MSLATSAGTKQTQIDVRFGAAGGGIADVARPDQAEPIYEYASLNQNSAAPETSPTARC
jgi:hypothetical protein